MTTVLVVDGVVPVEAIMQAPDLDLVGEAADAVEAVSLSRSVHPDVVVLDVELAPVVEDIAAVGAKVLVVATADLAQRCCTALRDGAAGVLLRHAPTHRLHTAIRTVAAGEALFSPSTTRRLVKVYARACPSIALQRLSPRELDVLRLVARGLSNTEIAEQFQLSVATVRTHLDHVLAKLALASRAQAVVVAYEAGLT